MDDLKSRYSVFLENYNKGNTYYESLYNIFLESIKIDLETISREVNNHFYRQKFSRAQEYLQSDVYPAYQKVLFISIILAEVAGEIFLYENDRVKSCILKFSMSLLNLVKETQDNQLLSLMTTIVENIDASQHMNTV